MSNLSPHIATLLMMHDCVIVPHFGGFIANAVGAEHNPISHKFTPPSRRFSFNSSLKANDGLLIQSFAEKSGISYIESDKEIQSEVSAWTTILENKETLILDELGSLTQTEDGRLIFEPNLSKSNSKASFGLEPFHRMPIVVEKEEQPIQEQSLPEVKITSRKRNWSYVAAALTMPVIGYMGYMITQTGLFKADQEFAVAELNPFKNSECALYEQREITPLVTTILETEENWLQLTSDEEVVPLYLTDDHSDDLVVWVRLKDKKTASIEMHNFYLIAGCFGNQVNAMNLVESLKENGYPASIIDKNKGLYRVSAEGFTTRKKAEEALSSIRTSVAPSAWLLSK